MSFDYLKKIDVKGTTTVEYQLNQIPLEPVPFLVLQPATEANKPYFNALLKQSGKSLANMRTGSINAKMAQERRDQDKELYSKFIIAGWGNLPDSDGNDVLFNKANCREFLDQLPDWIFDDVRSYATKPENFVADVFDIGAKAQD